MSQTYPPNKPVQGDPAPEEWRDLWQQEDAAQPAGGPSQPSHDHPSHEQPSYERPSFEQIRRRAKRQDWTFRLWALGDILTALGLTLFGAWHLAHNSTTPDLVLALFIWVLVLAATTFSFWNRRSIWQSHGETAADYLALTHLRCRRRLLGARFALYLLLVEVVLLVPWFYWTLAEDPIRLTGSPRYWWMMGGLVGGMLLFLIGYRLWVGRQLRQVEGLMGEINPPPGRVAPDTCEPEPPRRVPEGR